MVKDKVQRFAFLLFLEIFIIIVIMKVYGVHAFFIPNSDSTFYFLLQILFNDSIIFFLIFFFFYLSCINLHKIFSLTFRVLSFLVFIMYIGDIFILSSFTTHLVLDDIFKFASYAPNYLYNELPLYLFIFSILIFLVLIYLSFHLIKAKIEIKKLSSHILILNLVFINIPLYLLADNGRFVHSWLYKNFLEYNYEVMKQSQGYSQEFKEKVKNTEVFTCKKTTSTKKDIIILMVESLASYQSQFFSNIKNWTPNLDKIAQNNYAFTNFYANGFMTEDAEISILTGKFPIYAPKVFSDGGGVSFNGFYNLPESLPYILNQKGYSTEFITSADLNFSNTGTWAKSIGFNYIEGSENSYYDDKKRYHFKAASDEYLYDRVLKRISKQTNNYFLFIKTVSSHVPFVNPENENLSEEETIRYIDKHIGLFYKNLEKINFFENGILFIVGDHHPLVPLKNTEIEKFGETRAPSLVPMIIVNKDKKIVYSQFQQTDIYNSIKNYNSDSSCTSKWKGDLFYGLSPEFIVHRRGDQRGIISVFTKNKDYNIKLQGDDTTIIDKQNIKSSEIIDKINYERIQRGKNKVRS